MKISYFSGKGIFYKKQSFTLYWFVVNPIWHGILGAPRSWGGGYQEPIMLYAWNFQGMYPP